MTCNKNRDRFPTTDNNEKEKERAALNMIKKVAFYVIWFSAGSLFECATALAMDLDPNSVISNASDSLVAQTETSAFLSQALQDPGPNTFPSTLSREKKLLLLATVENGHMDAISAIGQMSDTELRHRANVVRRACFVNPNWSDEEILIRMTNHRAAIMAQQAVITGCPIINPGVGK